MGTVNRYRQGTANNRVCPVSHMTHSAPHIDFQVETTRLSTVLDFLSQANKAGGHFGVDSIRDDITSSYLNYQEGQRRRSMEEFPDLPVLWDWEKHPWLKYRPVLPIDPLRHQSLLQILHWWNIRSVRQCSKCDELFLTHAIRQTGPQTCSVCCKVEQRDRKRRWRAETKQEVQPRRCVVCDTEFTPKRSDAKVCSSKCRTKLSRSKAKA